MDDQMLRSILQRLAKLERESARLRIGEVTDVSPLDVALGGSDVSYTDVKAVGAVTTADQVAALVSGNDLLVLGRIADGGGSARVFRSVSQGINDNTLTALAFDSERWDSSSFHDIATNNTRLTAPTAGVYMIVGNLQFAPHATGFRLAQIRLNGTTAIAEQIQHTSSGTLRTSFSIATLYALAAGNYVELMAQQNSGGALNVEATGSRSLEFSIVRYA